MAAHCAGQGVLDVGQDLEVVLTVGQSGALAATLLAGTPMPTNGPCTPSACYLCPWSSVLYRGSIAGSIGSRSTDTGLPA